MRGAYLTELSDAECAYLQPHFPAPKVGARPRIHSLREILDAIFYIARSGCAWRLLPHDFPPCKTVHHYFRIWRIATVHGSDSTRVYLVAMSRLMVRRLARS